MLVWKPPEVQVVGAGQNRSDVVCSTVSRRQASIALVSLIPFLDLRIAQAKGGNPGLFRADNSEAESVVSRDREEEKVAISSSSLTDPLTTRLGDEKLQSGQVWCLDIFWVMRIQSLSLRLACIWNFLDFLSLSSTWL